MDSETSSNSVPIQPVTWLQSRLRQAGGRNLAIEIASFALASLSLAVGILALYAVSDFLVDFPRGIRIVLSLLLLAAAAFFAWRVGARWIRPLRTPDQVARAVERARDMDGQSLKSVIVSALEFGERPAIPGSAALKNEVIRQAQSGGMDPKAVILHDRRRVRFAVRSTIAAGAVLGLWMGFAFPHMLVFLVRAAGGAVRYPTATHVRAVDWQRRAPSRQDYSIGIRAAGKLPSAGTLTVKFAGRRAYRLPVLPVTNGTFTATVPGPEKPFWFEFVLGDYRSERFPVDIRTPVSVAEGTVVVTPPAYTGLERRSHNLGNVTVPEGSAVEFRIAPSQPVRHCDLAIGERRLAFQRATGDIWTASARIDESCRYEIELMGEDGLANIDRLPWTLNVLRDVAPHIEVSHPKPNTFLCNLSLLQFDFDVKDDYGIQSLSLEYEVYRRRSEKDQNEVLARKGAIPTGARPTGRSETVHVGRQMKELAAAAGERFVFKAVATDNRADKGNRGESDQISIFIVTPEELRSILEGEQTRIAGLMRKLKEDIEKQAEAVDRRRKEPAV